MFAFSYPLETVDRTLILRVYEYNKEVDRKDFIFCSVKTQLKLSETVGEATVKSILYL